MYINCEYDGGRLVLSTAGIRAVKILETQKSKITYDDGSEFLVSLVAALQVADALCEESARLPGRELLAAPVRAIGLLPGVVRVLNKAGVVTVGSLVDCSPDYLLSLAGFGYTGLSCVRDRLQEHGLRLGYSE